MIGKEALKLKLGLHQDEISADGEESPPCSGSGRILVFFVVYLSVWGGYF